MSKPELRAEPEPPLGRALPICDAHHHLWERVPNVYLLGDLRADLASGHNVVSTVAIECGYGYRADGPELMKPVGETEFLESIGAEGARDGSIKTRIAAAIVGFADLALGERVAAVP